MRQGARKGGDVDAIASEASGRSASDADARSSGCIAEIESGLAEVIPGEDVHSQSHRLRFKNLFDVWYAFTYHKRFSRDRIMAVLTASAARANLYRLIDQAAESHQPIVIAGKRSSAVLVSEEDWQAIQETMFLLSIPGMRKSIRDAMAEPLTKSAKELNW